MIVKLLLLLSFIGVAQAGMTEIGKVQCFDRTSEYEGVQFEGSFCTYTLKNLANVSELQRKVEQALFNGDPLVAPDGILEAFGNNNQTLIFSHQNEAVLQRMIVDIPKMDSKEEFSPSDVIKLRADIYEVSETGMSNIGAGITELNIGPDINDGLDNLQEARLNSDGLGVNLRAGIFQVSGLIAREKQRGNLRRITQIEGDSYNLDRFEYSDIAMKYQAPGAGTTVKEHEKGIRLSTKVSINNSRSDTVVLKDLYFYYGTENEDGSINALNIPKKRLVLQEGIMVPLLSFKSTGTITRRTSGILNFGRQETTEKTKLLVYLSVEITSWKDYIANMSKNKALAYKAKFTKEEKKKLPSKCPSLSELVDSIQTTAFRGIDGEPVLTFMIDKELACKSNIKQRFYVTTRINGNKATANNTQIYRLEELMHRPVRIKDIGPQLFLNEWIDFTVSIAPFRGRTTQSNSVNLIFINGVNPDIDDDFYVNAR